MYFCKGTKQCLHQNKGSFTEVTEVQLSAHNSHVTYFHSVCMSNGSSLRKAVETSIPWCKLLSHHSIAILAYITSDNGDVNVVCSICGLIWFALYARYGTSQQVDRTKQPTSSKANNLCKS